MEKRRVGLALCGSYCTYEKLFAAAERLKDRYELVPIMSENAAESDSRFGTAAEHIKRLMLLTGKKVVTTIVDAEPLGPAQPMDALLIAPCTGNTLAKMAQGITDSAVTMAAKAHLRCDRPTLIALASNDSMSANLANIATLLGRKQVFFVPMRQDDPEKKPHSLVADFTYLPECLTAALAGHQLRPLFL